MRTEKRCTTFTKLPVALALSGGGSENFEVVSNERSRRVRYRHLKGIAVGSVRFIYDDSQTSLR